LYKYPILLSLLKILFILTDFPTEKVSFLVGKFIFRRIFRPNMSVGITRVVKGFRWNIVFSQNCSKQTKDSVGGLFRRTSNGIHYVWRNSSVGCFVFFEIFFCRKRIYKNSGIPSELRQILSVNPLEFLSIFAQKKNGQLEQPNYNFYKTCKCNIYNHCTWYINHNNVTTTSVHSTSTSVQLYTKAPTF